MLRPSGVKPFFCIEKGGNLPALDCFFPAKTSDYLTNTAPMVILKG
jgi:hypothetical protein